MGPLYSHKAHGLFPELGCLWFFGYQQLFVRCYCTIWGISTYPEKRTPNYGINYLTGNYLMQWLHETTLSKHMRLTCGCGARSATSASKDPKPFSTPNGGDLPLLKTIQTRPKILNWHSSKHWCIIIII